MIFEDLERRRLQALYDGDREAFTELFANEAYLEGSLGAFDEFEFEEFSELEVRVFRIVGEAEDCIAFETTVTVNGQTSSLFIMVLERRSDGAWGLSFAGTGWICDGPHPLGS